MFYTSYNYHRWQGISENPLKFSEIMYLNIVRKATDFHKWLSVFSRICRIHYRWLAISENPKGFSGIILAYSVKLLIPMNDWEYWV